MLVDVALPVPLFQSFTYEVDDAAAPRAATGMRAVVPFHGRKMLGVILGPGSTKPGLKLKRVHELPDRGAVVSPALIELARWMSEYYVVPIGVVLRTILPAALTGASDPTPSAKTRRVIVMERPIESLLERDTLFARSPKQRALYELV